MAGRTILITGASGGIGAALARALAGPGVRLVLWGRDCARLNDVMASCAARGAECHIEALDIRDAEAQAARLAQNDGDWPIDLAIFNAGIGGMPPRDSAAETVDAARATAEVNFLAPVIGANLVAARMAARGRGHIVLIGSVAGFYPLPQAPAYSATKAGLAVFAEALGLRLKPHGVAVTLVAPGFIDTAMSRGLPPPKPFLMDADKAARIILRGIARRRRRIVLPWQFALIVALTRLVPRPLLRFVLSRA